MGHTYADIVEIATMTPLTKDTYEKLVKTAPFTSVTFKNASDARDLEDDLHAGQVPGRQWYSANGK